MPFIRRGRSSVYNPTSAQTQLGQAMVDNSAANTGGTVNDPSVYQKAIDSLKGNNTPAAVEKKAEWQKQMAALQMTQSKATNTVKNLNGAFLNAQYFMGKQYATNPQQLIVHMQALYENHAYQINQQLAKWKASNVDPGKYAALQTYQDQISREFQSLKDGSGNFAFLAHTNKDGKIESFTFQPVNLGPDGNVTATTGSQYAKEKYARTYSTYGGYPLLLNSQPSADPNKQTGIIGNLHFVGDTGKPMDLADMNGPVNKIAKRAQELLPGQHVRENKLESQGPGEMADRINADAGPVGLDKQTGQFKALHFSDKDFITPEQVGPGSLFRDVNNTYYYVNEDGDLKQGNSDTLSQITGMPKQQIESTAPVYDTGIISDVQSRQTPEARQNTWITNPNLDSPLNSASSPSSMLQPGPASPATAMGNNPGTELAATTGKQPGIQAPGGDENQQQTTDQITKGGPSLFAKAGAAVKGLFS